MLKMKCAVFLCLTFVVVNAHPGAVSFIVPCHINDDDCLLESAKKAYAHFIKGLPDLGIPTFEPLHLNEINGDSGELKLKLTNVDIKDFSKCEIIKMKRPDQNLFEIELICPITVTGDYVMDGKLFVLPIDGDGPFQITLPKIKIAVSVKSKVVEKNGEKHYKFTGFDYSYDALEKVHYKFQNLCHGDRARAEPIESIMDQSWKEIINNMGKPVVKEIIGAIVSASSNLFNELSISQLEKE